MELKRLVIALGEWVEREPRGLFERISGKQAAAERDARLARLVSRVERIHTAVAGRIEREAEMYRAREHSEG